MNCCRACDLVKTTVLVSDKKDSELSFKTIHDLIYQHHSCVVEELFIHSQLTLLSLSFLLCVASFLFFFL